MIVALGLTVAACTRQPPPEDPNEAAAEDNALNQVQQNALEVQAAGVILSDPNVGKPPTGEAANVQ